MPPKKSRYLLPSASHRYCMLAWSVTSGSEKYVVIEGNKYCLCLRMISSLVIKTSEKLGADNQHGRDVRRRTAPLRRDSGDLTCLGNQWLIRIRTAIAEELPCLPDFGNHIEIKVRYHNLILIATGLRNDLAARIAEIALPVKFADSPGLLNSDAINRSNEVSVGNSMRRLFEFPEIFGETSNCCRWIKYDLGSIQSENARALGEMAVVADVDPNPSIARLEDEITRIARREIELLPESRSHLRNVMLPVFPEIGSVGVDNRGSVEVQACHLFFVYRNDDNHLVLRGALLHQLRRWTVWNALSHLVPLLVLLSAEIRTVKKFLKTQDLHLLLRSLLDQLQVLVDHRLLDLGKAVIGAKWIVGLDEATADSSGHSLPRIQNYRKLTI